MLPPKGIDYFARKDAHISVDEVYAVSHDRKAVKWSVDQRRWEPISPSLRLAEMVLNAPRFMPLESAEYDRIFRFIDPPRNFTLE